MHLGGDVHDVGDLAVAASGQTVTYDVAAGSLDRCAAGVAGEVIGAREAGDVTDVAEDPGGEDVADTARRGQRGAAGSDRGCTAFAVGGHRPITSSAAARSRVMATARRRNRVE